MCKFSHLLSGLLQLPLRPHSFQPLQLIQNAAARLVFNLPRPSHVIPLMQSLHWLLVSNTKSCCWQTKRDPHMYATRPLSRSTHTGLLSCFFGVFLPPLSIQLATSILSQSGCCSSVFLTSPPLHPHTTISAQKSNLCLFYNYYNSGLLVGFCKFNCCTPIKFLRMRASVKLMKCKCQSFCLPLFFIFSPLVHEHFCLVAVLEVLLNIKLSVTWAHEAIMLVIVCFWHTIWHTCESTRCM